MREAILRSVDSHRDLILAAERAIWRNPETGYREWKTSRYLEDAFRALGYAPRLAGDIPGFTVDIESGTPGPRVLIFGELDSLLCADHPEADPQTHAVHACGHNAQCAALLGLAAALREAGALDGLSGSIRLCAVPAEELIEVGYREGLREQGLIRYFGGKVEFLHRGLLDGCDIAFMLHTEGGERGFSIGKGGNGCVTKNIAYLGLAAHAGGAPHEGVNALYAANLGMQAINALRETFCDHDHIRVHPIITRGGTAVNAIPAEVTLESYVRGATIEAIAGANRRVNRALAASAAAMGAQVLLKDRPGYTPLLNDPTLAELAERAALSFLPRDLVVRDNGWGTGCTDMGDISAVMPAIHGYIAGASGACHGNDFAITNPESACVDSAKAQLLLLRMLLEDGAAEAKRVLAEAKPRYPSFDAFFEALDAQFMDKQGVVYEGERRACLDF